MLALPPILGKAAASLRRLVSPLRASISEFANPLTLSLQAFKESNAW